MRCRSCDSELRPFLDLGTTPLANSFLREEHLSEPEPSFPLVVGFCEGCTLVQLMDTVPPERIFRDYVYVTATSSTVTEHFHALARQAVERFGLDRTDLVVEFGSNDGTLLKGFEPFGIRTLGVEPATNVAEIAERNGVRTVNEFFGPDVARRLQDTEGPASFMVGCNVVAHIPDINGTFEGVATLLSEKGVFQLEAPYLVDLLERAEFDTVYHEHFFYFSLHALRHVAERHGLRIFDLERVPVHGGSIRPSFCHAQASFEEQPAVVEALADERRRGLDRFETYTDFAERVASIRSRLLALLRGRREAGETVAGYGAAAKGNTLLNYCGIGPDLVGWVADKNPLKVGLFTPGMHLPVVPATRLGEERPDYTLILAWNMADEIAAEQDAYRRAGGHFIVPIPEPAVIDGSGVSSGRRANARSSSCLVGWARLGIARTSRSSFAWTATLAGRSARAGRT
jgi:C-methyltransferase C-terminal domain/Putative zinc binding domain/Methyltransferase domain